MFRLDEKVAVVTGGASGIGKAICEGFARQGAQVLILDLNEDSGNALAKALTEEGHQAAFLRADVTDTEAIDALFGQITRQYQKVDVLVNNAGVGFVGNVEQTEPEDLDRLYNINVKGVYNCLKAAIGPMKANGGGAIINMASIVSAVGIPDRFAYSMTKGAVWTMTLSIAKDYVEDNIRANCIAPARVHTPFVDSYLSKNYPGEEEEVFQKLAATQPIGRMAKPEEVAALALYLASDEAAFATGSLYPLDGGFITINN